MTTLNVYYSDRARPLRDCLIESTVEALLVALDRHISHQEPGRWAGVEMILERKFLESGIEFSNILVIHCFLYMLNQDDYQHLRRYVEIYIDGEMIENNKKRHPDVLSEFPRTQLFEKFKTQ